MRRLILLAAACAVAAPSAAASAGPLDVRFDGEGNVCYSSDWVPIGEQCQPSPVSAGKDGVSVRTEPVKADVGPDGACAWLFSLPPACV